MNCDRVREILTELVSGELDGETAAGAEEHIRECPECAAKRAACDRALSMLSNTPAYDVPESLSVLKYPEEQKRGFGWLRPAAIAAAFAAGIAFVLFAPGFFRAPKHDIAKLPPKPVQTAPKVQKQAEREVVVAKKPQEPVRNQVYKHPKRIVKITPVLNQRIRHIVRVQPMHKMRPVPAPEPVKQAVLPENPPAPPSTAPVIVIASWVDPEKASRIEITTTDYATGTVTTYTESAEGLEHIWITPALNTERGGI